MATPGPLPAEVRALLDGERLAEKVGRTFLLATTGSDGWPHLAMLSVGEVLVLEDRSLGLALHAGSGSTAALVATGRALLLVIVEGAAHRLQLEVEHRPVPERAAAAAGLQGLAFFAAAIVGHREDVAAYAELTSGVTFTLRDPSEVVARWQAQVAAIATLTPPDPAG
jgi:hypothetical protein